MKISRGILFAAAIGVAINLTGCGGGSSSATSSTGGNLSKVIISGTVSAPGTTTGAIAFAKPDNSILHQLANLFSSQQALADAVAGTAPVGSGVTVNLIQIGDNGIQVSGVIATGTTTSTGTYTIDAPASFVPATNYVVRATSATDNTKYLDAIVTSTSVDVDPSTDVAKDLVITAASGVGLTTIKPEAVAEIQNTVENLSNEIDSTSFFTLAATKSLLIAQYTNDEEASNIISSIVSSGVINGTVKDTAGTPLPNIKIVVRDFGNWVTRAVTRTDASGAYTLHVPSGDYILGAINMTATSTAASEWWTSGGGATNQFSAGKITVTTTVTKDFVLEPGVRISGTVTGANGTLPVRGIQIQLRDFINDEVMTTTHTHKDGTYRINVRPGSYTVGAYNMTLQPYATQLYNSTLTNGGTNASQAEKITLVLGTPKTANFNLQVGRIVAGTVTDGTNPVPGMAVRFYTSTGAFVRGIRTNKIGKYRLWLLPNTSTADKYIVRSRGQTLSEDLSATGQLAQDFTAVMGTITATLSDGTNPVSQAKVFIYDAATNTNLGFETSNADGSVTLYAAAPAKIEPVIDNGAFIATQFYNPTALANSIGAVNNANTVTVPSILGTITLNAGGVLSGVVKVAGVATGDRLVQVRSGGVAGGNHLINTRTQFDGSYSISLAAGTYNVRACNPDSTATVNCSNTAWTSGSSPGNYASYSITAGSTPQDFNAPN